MTVITKWIGIGIVLGFLTPMLWAANAFADVTSYTVGVDGMACPFCAYGIEKKLGKLKGVDKLEIHIKSAEVDLTLKKNSKVTPEQIEKAVKKAGFSIRTIVVEGAGDISGSAEAAVINFGALAVPIIGYTGAPGRFDIVGSFAKGADGKWALKLTAVEP